MQEGGRDSVSNVLFHALYGDYMDVCFIIIYCTVHLCALSHM